MYYILNFHGILLIAKIVGNPLKLNTADDQTVCMPGFQDIVLDSDKCYFISDIDDYQGWDDASDVCGDMIDYGYDVEYTSENTGLVSIETNNENNELFDEMTSYGIESAWIGLSWSGKDMI